MSNTFLPSTGPLRLDLRAASPLAALRAVEDTVLRAGSGPRIVVVRCEGAATIDALLHWADDLELPLERQVAPGGGGELRFYLLPDTFGEHPLTSTPAGRERLFRPPEPAPAPR